MDRHLWLIGMMGSGKTAAAVVLAGRWDAAVIDTDAEVEAAAGESITRLWAHRGEEEFRRLEADAVERASRREPAVVSTGGGVVLDAGNVAAMRRSGRVVWLAADPTTLSKRVGSGAGRPLVEEDASNPRLAAILGDREEAYSAAADLVVDTAGLTIDEVADRIEAWWKRF